MWHAHSLPGRGAGGGVDRAHDSNRLSGDCEVSMLPSLTHCSLVSCHCRSASSVSGKISHTVRTDRPCQDPGLSSLLCPPSAALVQDRRGCGDPSTLHLPFLLGR